MDNGQTRTGSESVLPMTRLPTTDDRRIRCRKGRAATVVALMATFTLLAGMPAPAGLAAENVGSTTVTLGESNTEAQRQELLEFFAAGPDAEIIEVSVDDTREAMGGIFETSIDSAYSSTALTCRDLGDGLDVSTRNIQVVTPAMYAIALVTAGIGDATLVVAAPDNAPALGMTSLTGVFKTWERTPCASGATNQARQRLAVKQLALIATIGQELQAAGTADGIQRAANAALETQKSIINEGLRDPDAIDEALAAQEEAQGIEIPAAERGDLLDILEQLANSSIDWSTFAKGWTIEYAGDNRITMRGDGIAIRNAQASATAEAAAALTATAQAREAAAQAENAAAMTATAEAAAVLTVTAQAQEAAALTATAQAQATADAIAALTATAAAPGPTATPVPTATPAPFSFGGTVVGRGDGRLIIRTSRAPTGQLTHRLDPRATITRDGDPATMSEVLVGDSVRLTIDGKTGRVVGLSARTPRVGLATSLARFWWVAAIGLLTPATLWRRRRRRAEEPFIIAPRATS